MRRSVLRTVALALLAAAKVSLAASPSSSAPLPPGTFAFERASLGGLGEPAAVAPKLFRVYENTDHAMTSADGLQERYRWLARELQLKER